MAPLLGLAAVILAIYGVILGAPFIYDDLELILANPRVIGPWPGWVDMLSHTFTNTGEYEPAVVLFHRLFYQAFGAHVLPYRLSSLILHWANAALLWSLARRLLKDKSLALWAALLFAAYPAHVEVLAVSTFRKHLFTALGALTVLNLQAAGATPRRTVLACLAFAASLLAKESALMTFPLSFLFSLALSRELRPRAQDRVLLAALAAIAAAFVVWRVFFIPRAFPHVPGSWGAHAATSAKILLWYVSRWPFPWSLSLEHPLRPAASLWSLDAGAASLGTLAAAAGTAWLWRRGRVMGLGAAWGLLALLPFLNLIPYLNLSLVADRYHYLSSAGVFVAAAAALKSLPARRLRLALSCWLAAFAAAGISYGARFTLALDVHRNAADRAPSNPRAQASLGLEYHRRRLYPEAEASFRRALELFPGYSDAALDLAVTLAETGRLKQAVALTEEAARARPLSRAWHNLGAFHAKAGRWERGRRAAQEALRLEPGRPDSRLLLGTCLLELGRLETARTELEAASRAPQTRARALAALGDLERRRGDSREAARLYEESLDLEPYSIETIRRFARAGGDPERTRRLLEQLAARAQGARDALGAGGRPENRGMRLAMEEAAAEARRELASLALRRR